MFAGIIEKTARVRLVQEVRGMLRVTIEKPRGWKLALGQSIDIDGVCSTVVRRADTFFEVEYMPETLSKTTVSAFLKGRVVNLERSLKYGQRIDGHPVQGHVDMMLPVREISAHGSSREILLMPPAPLARQIALHGSIALNGVSLTVARKRGLGVTVALIPYSLKHTNLGDLLVGDPVNIELDHSRAYLARMRKK